MVKELKPIITPIKDEEGVAREIFKFLKQELLQPLLDEIEEKQKLYYNDAPRSLIFTLQAIKSGKIGYSNGILKGAFNSRIIKELQQLGFNFDKRIKGFRLNPNDLPITIQLAIGRTNLSGKQLATSLLTRLSNINIDESIKKLALEKKYLDILSRIDRSIIETTSKSIGLDIITTENQKIKLAQDFTNNMKLFIKGFAEDEIVKLRKKVEDSVFEGIRAESLKDDIKKEFNTSKNKSNFLAKQEISLFTSKYKQAKYQELGINKYRWSTSRDSRVREDHRDLNNKVFTFDNPPITNKETGSRTNPGEDFGCRCVAIPIVE